MALFWKYLKVEKIENVVCPVNFIVYVLECFLTGGARTPESYEL